jgi:hypothetical protein
VTNDGIPDLVTIVRTAVQVRPRMSGTARTIYPTTHGERIAIGDATKDGRREVYVLRSNPLNRTNPQDVVLINSGTAWSPVAVPNASGIGDFALYLTGLQGYLVGNGRAESIGKLQAITVRRVQ